MADLIFSTFSSEHTVTLPEDKFYETFVRMHGFQPSREVLEQKLFLTFDRTERLIKLKVEREDICVFSKKCEDPHCELLHNIRKMDYCRSFTSFDGCPRQNECQFLHVPSMRLCDRVVSVFGWRGSQNMSEADFIDQHARVYPYDHQPIAALLPHRLPFIRLERRGTECEVYLEIDLDRDICKSWLSNCCSLKRSCRYLHPKYYCREFAAHKTCRKYPHCPFWHIAGKFISPPPSRAETTPRLILTQPANGSDNPHGGHQSVVLTNLDERWEDDALISDIREMFVSKGFKVVDIFMRGRIRLAFVQLGSEDECKICIKELDDSWCYNRIVRVERAHRGEHRICIKTLNSEVVDVEVKHWLEPFNLRVQRVCIEEKFSFGSNIAFIFLKDQDECERAIALLHQREKLRGRTVGVEHPRSVPLIHQLPLRHTHEPDAWPSAQQKEREQFDEFDTRSNARKKRTLRNPANVQTSHPSFRNSRLRKHIRGRGETSSKPSSVISGSTADDLPHVWISNEMPNLFLQKEDTKEFGGIQHPGSFFGYDGDNEWHAMNGMRANFNPPSPELSPSSLSTRQMEKDEVKQNMCWFERDSASVAGSVPELPTDAAAQMRDINFWNGYMFAMQKMGGQMSGQMSGQISGQMDANRMWCPPAHSPNVRSSSMEDTMMTSAGTVSDVHDPKQWMWNKQMQDHHHHLQQQQAYMQSFGGYGHLNSNAAAPSAGSARHGMLCPTQPTHRFPSANATTSGSTGQFPTAFPMERMPSSTGHVFPSSGNGCMIGTSSANGSQNHGYATRLPEWSNFDGMSVEEYGNDVHHSFSLGAARGHPTTGFVTVPSATMETGSHGVDPGGCAALAISSPLAEASDVDIEMEDPLQEYATAVGPANGNVTPRGYGHHQFFG